MPLEEPKPNQRRRSALLSLASLVIIVAGLRAAAPILQPLLLALFLAILSFPLLSVLRRRGVGTPVAILATVVAVIALTTIFGYLMTNAVSEFAVAAPDYWEKLQGKATAALSNLESRGVKVSDWIAVEPIEARHAMDVLGGVLGGTVKGVASVISFVTLVVVALIFTLYELVILPSKLRAAFGDGSNLSHHFAAITKEIQRYLGIKTVINAATGVIIGIWAAATGLDFPLFWGLMAFLLNYIPVLGSIIAGVPTALLALVQYDWVRALIVAAGYLVVKVVIGDLIEPHLMGRKFGLSTLVVFVSVVFWAWVWGPLGMILAVPLTIVIKITVKHTEEFRWIAALLGPDPSTAAPLIDS